LAIKALRELRQSIRDTDALSEKDDVLNLDGERFTAVMRHIVRLFGQSMRTAGLPDGQRDSILREFRDLWNNARGGAKEGGIEGMMKKPGPADDATQAVVQRDCPREEDDWKGVDPHPGSLDLPLPDSPLPSDVDDIVRDVHR
jgi:hypothetical protein